MTDFLPVMGTHELDDRNDWARGGSPLRVFLAKQGLAILPATRPFEWTTNLDIHANGWDWQVGGENLYDYCIPPIKPEVGWPGNLTRLLTHSHGLQVALYAAAKGLKIDVLFDVAGPVRKDMMIIARLARPNIRRWVHVYSDHTDKWQWLGELGDGHLGIVRTHPFADRNVKLPGAGHTGFLRDPQYFHSWIDSAADGAILTAELKGLV